MLVLIFIRLSLLLTNWLQMDPCFSKQVCGAAWHFLAAGACRTNPTREHPLKSAPGISCACSQHPPWNMGREFDVTNAVFVLKGLKLSLPRGFQPLK